jgi:hypothetical protein
MLTRAGLPVGNDAGVEALSDVFDGTLSDDAGETKKWQFLNLL